MKKFKKLIAFVMAIVTLMATAVPAMADSNGHTILGGVNVRSGPGSNYGRVGSQIANGSSVKIMFPCEGTTVSGSSSVIWYYVEEIDCACGSSSCNAPYEGYIHSSCVSSLPSIPRPGNMEEAFGHEDYLLKLGSKGPEVYNLQLVLYANGYFTQIGECDGLFGSATRDALEDFQRDHGIGIDGIAGSQTKSRLWQYRYYVMNPSKSVFSNYGVDCSSSW